VKLRGAWMTKLEAALRRVLRGRLVHPGDKWLVFSAFPDALGMLGKALAANGVQAAQLKGNREVPVSCTPPSFCPCSWLPVRHVGA
jgi:hypothetical protein